MLIARMVQTLTLCFILLSPALLWAADSIELLSRVEKVVVTTNEKGEKVTVIEPAAKVVPGESVVYTNTYRNVGAVPAGDIVINNPIPEHTSYIGDSAFGDGTDILFSADGGNTFAPDGKVTIKDEDGKERPARLEEYTHIRWIVKNGLNPGASGEVGFWARLQ